MSQSTRAQKFFEDPRIQQAKQLIADATREHQKNIGQVQGPLSEQLAQNYEESLQKLAQNRGGNLFYRYLGSGFGNGPFVELADGSVKYDFITGIGVHYFGHSHPELMGAIIDGAISNTAMQGHLQQNTDSHRLISLLLEQANINQGQFEHCFLSSSGVMAVENALKICFQKNAPTHRVLAFERCFHGRTLGVSQITDKAAYRQGLPPTLTVDYLPFYDSSDHQGSIDRTCQQLQKYLKRYPCQYSCMIMEVIQGEGGSYPGHEDFFKAIIQILKENHISVIIDEVQSFGRTKNLYAFQYFKLDQLVDVVVIGKMSQVCATLFKANHKPKPGLLSQTFTSSSTAISASYHILSTMIKENYLGEKGKIQKIHQYFSSKLKELEKKMPDKITGPYGIGAMIAMTVYNGDMELSKKFSFDLFQNGVISFMAGANPTRIRFLIPMGAIETKHIDDVVSIIERTLQQTE